MTSETVRAARREAILTGAMFYEGSACRRCCGRKRYVLSGTCVACQRSYSRTQRAEIIRGREQARRAREAKQ
jgi:hypothetical protein